MSIEQILSDAAGFHAAQDYRVELSRFCKTCNEICEVLDKHAELWREPYDSWLSQVIDAAISLARKAPKSEFTRLRSVVKVKEAADYDLLFDPERWEWQAKARKSLPERSRQYIREAGFEYDRARKCYVKAAEDDLMSRWQLNGITSHLDEGMGSAQTRLFNGAYEDWREPYVKPDERLASAVAEWFAGTQANTVEEFTSGLLAAYWREMRMIGDDSPTCWAWGCLREVNNLIFTSEGRHAVLAVDLNTRYMNRGEDATALRELFPNSKFVNLQDRDLHLQYTTDLFNGSAVHASFAKPNRVDDLSVENMPPVKFIPSTFVKKSEGGTVCVYVGVDWARRLLYVSSNMPSKNSVEIGDLSLVHKCRSVLNLSSKNVLDLLDGLHEQGFRNESRATWILVEPDALSHSTAVERGAADKGDSKPQKAAKPLARTVKTVNIGCAAEDESVKVAAMPLRAARLAADSVPVMVAEGDNVTLIKPMSDMPASRVVKPRRVKKVVKPTTVKADAPRLRELVLPRGLAWRELTELNSLGVKPRVFGRFHHRAAYVFRLPEGGAVVAWKQGFDRRAESGLAREVLEFAKK